MSSDDEVKKWWESAMGHFDLKKLLTEYAHEVLCERRMVPKAACVLTVNNDGMILAVSRKDNVEMWGLPGGKVDPGESPADAAARELQEETGLIAHDLQHAFTRVDSQGYETITFTCTISGQIDSDEEGMIRWVDMQTLLDPSSTPYSDYNQALFTSLGML